MHQVCQPLSALGDNTNQRWVNLPRSRCRGCMRRDNVLMRPKMLGLSSPRAAPPHELGHTSKPTGVSAHLRLDTVLPPACRPLYTAGQTLLLSPSYRCTGSRRWGVVAFLCDPEICRNTGGWKCSSFESRGLRLFFVTMSQSFLMWILTKTFVWQEICLEIFHLFFAVFINILIWRIA